MPDIPEWNWTKYNELIKHGIPSPLVKRIKALEVLLIDVADFLDCPELEDAINTSDAGYLDMEVIELRNRIRKALAD